MLSILLKNKLKFLIFLLLTTFCLMALILLVMTMFNKKDSKNVSNSTHADLSKISFIKDAVIIDNAADLAKYKFDQFDYKNAYLENGLLNIVVGYGGGCANHDFDLLVDNEQQSFILAHNANNDLCKAYITKRTLSFNLLDFLQIIMVMVKI